MYATFLFYFISGGAFSLEYAIKEFILQRSRMFIQYHHEGNFMRCYSVSRGRIIEGLPLSTSGKFGMGVYIGASQRTKWSDSFFISLDKYDTPLHQDQRVTSCSVKKVTPKKEGRVFYTLTQNQGKPDRRALIRLDTDGPYTKNCNGFAQSLEGEPKFLIEANVRTSMSGVQYAYQYLLIMSPGDVVKVIWAGGRKAPSEVLIYDELFRLSTMPYSDYQSQMALKSDECEVELI